jgi:hypothetical protein
MTSKSSTNLPQPDWESVLDRYMAPNYPNVFVLGCFATHLTLYSQQVRALNLVAALWKTGTLTKDTRAAVIGGGAAGLMAAAGIAFLGVKNVRVLDQLEGPMELQKNNRQRWLHPHIYDWPDPIWEHDNAELPLITWSAGYAENVATQIERYWQRLERELNIQTSWNTSVQLSLSGGEVDLLWEDPVRGQIVDPIDIVILAVGFGLEPERDGQRSYWDEDDIDGSFRRSPDKKKKWLVAGCGDGGLTDLIRLCLKRFRHEEIAKTFARDLGIDGAIKDLESIHSDPKAEDPKFLTQAFQNMIMVEGWSKLLRDRRRRDNSEIYWTAQSTNYYGGNSSVLNRLIASHLCKIGAFKYRLGPVKEVKRKKNGYEVQFHDGKKEHFDRVILRYGPSPPALKFGFPKIWAACSKKRKAWSRMPRTSDPTLRKLWELNFFGLEPAPPIDEPKVVSAADQGPHKYGFRASSLWISKDIRSDGSSSVTYRIEGLEVTKPGIKIEGLGLSIFSATGQIGQPELDGSSQRLGIRWESRGAEQTPPTTLTEAQERLRRRRGVLEFTEPLTNNIQPVSFGVTFKLLNTDALSAWQFEQLYSKEDRVGFDRQPVEGGHPVENFAGIVWYPVDSFQLVLALPDEISAIPSISVFRTQVDEDIPTTEIIRNGIIESSPEKDSSWDPQNPSAPWVRINVQKHAMPSLAEISPKVWRLSAYRPSLGTCFSLDWSPPSLQADAPFRKLEAQSEALRRSLLKHRGTRLQGNEGIPGVREAFGKMYEGIRKRLVINKNEGFEVTLLVYDSTKQRLFVVEGLVDGETLPNELWEFSPPFGLGLAGACFKEGEEAFLYKRPEKISRTPELYIPLPGHSHEVLLAIPINHPALLRYLSRRRDSSRLELSRQCVGVLDVGSRSPKTKMHKLFERRGADVPEFTAFCQQMCKHVILSAGEKDIYVDPQN